MKNAACDDHDGVHDPETELMPKTSLSVSPARNHHCECHRCGFARAWQLPEPQTQLTGLARVEVGKGRKRGLWELANVCFQILFSFPLYLHTS